MTNYELYRQYIDEIRSFGLKNGLKDEEINKIFEECYKKFDKKYTKSINIILKLVKIFLIIIFSTLFGIIAVYNHPSTHNLFLRNMQNFIYPGFNIVRKISVPIVSRFPRITELYDESCLVENPFFYVSEMDCWPCNAIQYIPDMTGINITKHFNTGTPFTRLENEPVTDFRSIIEDFSRSKNNLNIFREDAFRVSSNNREYQTIDDVVVKRLDKYPSELKNTHITWRVNRMKPARILRKFFPKPIGTPDLWSQSVERFLLIDEPNSLAYNLPNPECSNVIMRAVSGKRLIKMIPSPECLQSCRSKAVVLSAGHTLWYNWWYWRPMSLPVINSTQISVQYIISLC